MKAQPSSRCVDSSFYLVTSCITTVTDVLVNTLLFWIFLGLNMPRAAKLAVLGIFAK